ncbi:MAG: ABC transporter permease subunit [Anaerolineaceae bacterium]|nr:ABC transporter permease subunit [Anaerolineaceae bacterium]
MNANPVEDAPALQLEPNKEIKSTTSWQVLGEKIIPGLTLVLALSAIVLGCLMLAQNSFEIYSISMLGIICVAYQLLFVDIYRQEQAWKPKVALISVFAFLALLVLRSLPEYITGLQVNGVIHRSLFSGIFLLAIGIVATEISIFYLFGATPQAEDISRYPLILVPVAIGLGVYIILILQLLLKGLPNLSWDIVQKAYFNYAWPIKTTIDDGWPIWSIELRSQIGLANHLSGTGLLMLLTTLISLPFGVGAGIYLSEYASGLFENIARFSVTALRAISTLILGMAAFSLVNYSGNTPLAFIFQGNYFDGNQWNRMGGSFFSASLVLSLLVIPIIARSTEEGCRSLPPELREGALALGASDQTTLWRIVIPWAMPNIVTAILLGCAEAAGSVAVIMFISGRGDYGVGIFRPVTSLAYLIFDIYYASKSFKLAMQPYQFTAGVLLLMITVGLSLAALLIKRWLVKRHRGE